MYWPYGRVVSHLRVRNAGVTAQRLEAWLPSHVDEENEGGNGDSSDGDDDGDKEEDDWFAEWKRFELENRQVAAFFEDDLEVSPLWFQWLQQALLARDEAMLRAASSAENEADEKAQA